MGQIRWIATQNELHWTKEQCTRTPPPNLSISLCVVFAVADHSFSEKEPYCLCHSSAKTHIYIKCWYKPLKCRPLTFPRVADGVHLISRLFSSKSRISLLISSLRGMQHLDEKNMKVRRGNRMQWKYYSVYWLFRNTLTSATQLTPEVRT